MKVTIKNLRFVTTKTIIELDKFADKEQIADQVRKALLKNSMIGDIEVK